MSTLVIFIAAKVRLKKRLGKGYRPNPKLLISKRMEGMASLSVKRHSTPGLAQLTVRVVGNGARLDSQVCWNISAHRPRQSWAALSPPVVLERASINSDLDFLRAPSLTSLMFSIKIDTLLFPFTQTPFIYSFILKPTNPCFSHSRTKGSFSTYFYFMWMFVSLNILGIITSSLRSLFSKLHYSLPMCFLKSVPLACNHLS